MIPKLHKKGTSFRGAALYLLHDKDASTTERVVHTETRNLATNNPEAAWRVMAATALDQNRLKAEAEIKATGRKSKAAVLHLSLAWHPDEADDLDRDEMVAAADAAVASLKAQDLQALYVIHDDEPQPHIHVLLNRISPTDGRMLSSSNEKRALSRWAEKYERDRGHIYCEERVLNNADRRRGLYTRGAKDVPRHIFELEAANRDEPWALQLRAEQKAKDLDVRRKVLAAKAKRQAEWSQLEADDAATVKVLRKEARRQVTIAEQTAAETFRDDWAELAVAQEQERVEFVEREQSLAGMGRNILNELAHINWSDLLRSDRRSTVLIEGFGLLAGRKSTRTESFRRRQARQNIELEKKETEARKLAARKERGRQARLLSEHRQKIAMRRQDLIFRHQMEESWEATLWQERRTQREKAWAEAREKQAKIAFEKTATPEDERRKAAEAFMGRMRKARSKREREKMRDKSTKVELKRDRDRDRDDDEWER